MALPNLSPLPVTGVASRSHVAQRRSTPRTGAARRATQRDVRLARGLGWLSFGLGALELAAPRRIARFLGLQEHDTVLRAVAAREIASGLGIFAQPHPTAGTWARVFGDFVDLALLFEALPGSTRRGRIMSAIAAVGGVAALDTYVADRLTRRSLGRGGDAPNDGSIEVVTSISVAATADEAYALWRKLDQLPTFMKHLESVVETSERRSHWIAKAPGGGTVEWDAEITDEVAGELLAWRSLDGASVKNEGMVLFTPDRAGRGTVIDVELRYAPPLGGAGVLVASLFGEEPSQQVNEDLRRLKQLLETGEIATTEGQPSGRDSKRTQPAKQRTTHDKVRS